jgi:hypothetical protein
MLPVARARVTFAVSPGAAETLCVPRRVRIEKDGDDGH